MGIRPKHSCQFDRNLPDDLVWHLKGVFEEDKCCGLPASCSLELSGFTYYLCAGHFDLVGLDLQRSQMGGTVDHEPVIEP
jgi:hypothetical protein